MQRRPAVSRGACVQLRTQARFGLGQGVDALRQRAVIEHGAADEQRDSCARKNFPDDADRVLAEAPGGISRGRIDEIDQVVRYGRTLYGGRLCGTDVHPAVNLRGVEADDFDRVRRGKPHCQPRLAAGGRTQENKNGGPTRLTGHP